MTPREEIEQAVKIIETYEIPGSHGLVKSIRRILATHELVPIDNTPFDPERCGFRRRIEMDPMSTVYSHEYFTITWWMDGSWRIDGYLIQGTINQSGEWRFPSWPTHSDGVRLLQLLGLEVRT